MKRVLCLLLLLAACASRPPVVSLPHPGFYGGGFGVAPDFIYTQIEFTEKDGLRAGRMWQPFNRVGSVPMRDIRFEGPRVRFDTGEGSDRLSFDLKRTDVGYRGTVTVDGRREPASFAIRPGSVDPLLLATYEGTYDLGGGRLLQLSRNNASSGFWYLDLPSLRTGFLYNISKSEFVAGPCFQCVEPLHLRFTVVRDAGGDVTGLRIGNRVAPRVRLFREEQVSFTSPDGTKLAGTLYLPLNAGPHAAVVLTHGSGAQTRNGYYGQIRFMAEAYARRGIAALAYDKRGTGGSTGDWERASLESLAQDAAAAVRLLESRPDIDPKRIGLSGASQSGHIIGLAIAHIPQVRLLQVRSGAPMNVEDQERLRLVLQMKADGFDQAEIDRALRVRGLMDLYAKTGQGWDELESAFKKVEKTFWAVRYIGGLPERSAPDWAWLREAFTFDAAPNYERYQGSVQALFAEHDTPTPVAQALPLFENALKRGGNKDYEMRIVPHATHNYYWGRTGGDKEFPGLSRYVPDHFRMVVDWAAKRFDVP